MGAGDAAADPRFAAHRVRRRAFDRRAGGRQGGAGHLDERGERRRQALGRFQDQAQRLAIRVLRHPRQPALQRHQPMHPQDVGVLEDDGWRARLTGPQGSGVLSSVARADGLMVVPEDVGELTAGSEVSVVRLLASDDAQIDLGFQTRMTK